MSNIERPINQCGIRLLIILTLLVLVCSSCSSISYYHQSISGHLSLISKREAISAIVNDPTSDKNLVQQLKHAQEAREFASTRLNLPENGSYHSFVQLDQPYVTWAVFAAPEFSVSLNNWCFLVIGCVQYRGYFQQQRAKKYADELSDKGLEVYVAGIPAYSTLGWFDDPLLSSMIDRGEIVTAAYIFHELSHQQFYVKGDSGFNEAFATAVEEIGVALWLEENNKHDQLEKYNEWLKQKKVFSEFIRSSRLRFEDLYAQELSEENKRKRKSELMKQMRTEFNILSTQHEQISRYANWMAGPLNNAQLGAISLYRELVPAFKNIYTLCDNDFVRFYARVKQISKLPIDKREQEVLHTQSC